MSYTKLLIWKQAKDLSIAIHKITFSLPRFEQYEEASQIRRSSKSIRSNIVEGYGRRRYKQDFIKFLVYALSSCDETLDHLDILFETESLKDKTLYESLREQTDKLGRHLNKFLSAVEKNHNTFEV
jgi:four helix bundle protein